jgi:hypothetical protein
VRALASGDVVVRVAQRLCSKWRGSARTHRHGEGLHLQPRDVLACD